MEITEVRIKLMDDPSDRLQAFCSITFDSAFVVRDLKIIQGTKGSFVAMPSRKLTDKCPRCFAKNELRSRHCSQCGARLDEDRAARDDNGRAKLYADIAHPINSTCRDMIQSHVLEAYEDELQKSSLPGYVCRYDDYGEECFAALAVGQELMPADDTQTRDEPLVVNGPAESSRRIEPAAEGTRPPHSADAVSEPLPDTVAHAVGSKATDDPFGAGVE